MTRHMLALRGEVGQALTHKSNIDVLTFSHKCRRTENRITNHICTFCKYSLLCAMCCTVDIKTLHNWTSEKERASQLTCARYSHNWSNFWFVYEQPNVARVDEKLCWFGKSAFSSLFPLVASAGVSQHTNTLTRILEQTSLGAHRKIFLSLSRSRCVFLFSCQDISRFFWYLV